MAARKKDQLALVGIPQGADKVGPLMATVLDCINAAAGTEFPFTKPKVRWLKAIVNGTPDSMRNEEWWTGFFAWIYRANFQGRKIEVSWSPDTLARNLDKYIDAYCNRKRFEVTSYSLEQAARDEWEIVFSYVMSSRGGPWSPPWGTETSEALRAIGGSAAIRMVKADEIPRVRMSFVREWMKLRRALLTAARKMG